MVARFLEQRTPR